MAVMPEWKTTLVRSGNVLKPCSSSLLMIMGRDTVEVLYSKHPRMERKIKGLYFAGFRGKIGLWERRSGNS
jgi:hypothetical protein